MAFQWEGRVCKTLRAGPAIPCGAVTVTEFGHEVGLARRVDQKVGAGNGSLYSVCCRPLEIFVRI